MGIRIPAMIWGGIALVAAGLVFFIVRKKNRIEFAKGQKIAGIAMLKSEPYFKKKIRTYKAFTWISMIATLVAILASSILIAQPYTSETRNEEKFNRDIILCLDVSTSVDEVNMNLVKELEDVVQNLNGERFGIVIFNTSPVLVSPLTDDYEYTIEQLEKIRQGLRIRITNPYAGIFSDEAAELFSYLEDGTLVGNEERGSSMISDGLASAAMDFPDKDADRSRVIIFATDNEPNGESYVSMQEAAQLCKQKNIIVYGVGTKEMDLDDKKEMKEAVESTGGAFYVEGESGSFEQIVASIKELSESAIEGDQYTIKTNHPMAALILLILSLYVLFISTKIIKK